MVLKIRPGCCSSPVFPCGARLLGSGSTSSGFGSARPQPEKPPVDVVFPDAVVAHPLRRRWCEELLPPAPIGCCCEPLLPGSRCRPFWTVGARILLQIYSWRPPDK
ncbi:unnamed protein product [Urochloa humidicola]